MSQPGVVALGPVFMADVQPAGSSVVLALAVWDSSGNWTDPGTKGGMVVFVNPTYDYLNPLYKDKGNELTGWSALGQNLVMFTQVPEPSTFVLAGVGSVVLLMFRRQVRSRTSAPRRGISR